MEEQQDKTVVRVHRSQYLAKPRATRRISRRKQERLIWLEAFSRSMVKRHRFFCQGKKGK